MIGEKGNSAGTTQVQELEIKTNKNNITIPDSDINKVSIVWFDLHVALCIDGKIKGWGIGAPSKVPSTLELSKKGLVEWEPTDFDTLQIQHLKLSQRALKRIQRWSNLNSLNSYLDINCIHAVSRILAKITSIRIPFLISLFPSLSKLYLRKMHADNSKDLGDLEEFSKGKAVSVINPKSEFNVNCLCESVLALLCTAVASSTTAFSVFKYFGLSKEAEKISSIARGISTIVTALYLWKHLK